MIVKHKRTGKLYKVLNESFSIERQKISVVYCQLETGYIFDRDKAAFQENFQIIDVTPQNRIEPHSSLPHHNKQDTIERKP